jgi:hypothetical protein
MIPKSCAGLDVQFAWPKFGKDRFDAHSLAKTPAFFCHVFVLRFLAGISIPVELRIVIEAMRSRWDSAAVTKHSPAPPPSWGLDLMITISLVFVGE